MICFNIGCPVFFHIGRCTPVDIGSDVIMFYVRENSVKHEPGTYSARQVKGSARLDLVKYLSLLITPFLVILIKEMLFLKTDGLKWS